MLLFIRQQETGVIKLIDEQKDRKNFTFEELKKEIQKAEFFIKQVAGFNEEDLNLVNAYIAGLTAKNDLNRTST